LYFYYKNQYTNNLDFEYGRLDFDLELIINKTGSSLYLVGKKIKEK